MIFMVLRVVSEKKFLFNTSEQAHQFQSSNPKSAHELFTVPYKQTMFYERADSEHHKGVITMHLLFQSVNEKFNKNHSYSKNN